MSRVEIMAIKPPILRPCKNHGVLGCSSSTNRQRVTASADILSIEAPTIPADFLLP